MFLHYEYVYMCELWCSDCYIMPRFMQQDNNIVKICVVNEAEDILVEVIITTRLVNF